MALNVTKEDGTSDTNGDIVGYSTCIPKNGRIIQNIIQGADLVMSHITHLYHLSALDFVDASALGPPWSPSYSTAAGLLHATGVNEDSTANHLVADYVAALAIRRKLHTAGALFSGRQPIQNALVPGGVTTLLASTTILKDSTLGTTDKYGPFNLDETKTRFKSLLGEARNFIDGKYIPDVLTVAGAFSDYWTMGGGCGNLLAYGEYPGATNPTSATDGTLAIKRGWTDTTLNYNTFDQNSIVEYVAYSYYDYPLLHQTDGLHPYSGVTRPDMAANVSDGRTPYTWAKSPRYMDGTTVKVMEVGPLARMAVCFAAGTGTAPIATSSNAIGALSIGAGGTYTAYDLVSTVVTSVLGGASAKLFSPLGRHAARALEAKYIADLMADWVDLLTDTSSGYTYKKIPKGIAQGYGLVEAPRGALGHWIKILGKKVSQYQCVVPTTWNVSPMDANGQKGPIEQSVMYANPSDTNVANVLGSTTEQQIVNILRLIHPFDICIACTVHVVNPEGDDMLKFAIGPDGQAKDIEVKK